MTDEILIKQCQAGDSAAFEDLLELHYEVIYRIAFRWCRDQSNAQDITQLVCMKLARALQQYSFQSSFTTWLYPLVINTAKDFYKSPTQRNTREQQVDDLESAAKVSSDRSEERLYAQQILQHISNLQDDLKETLILVYAKGLNHKQAADQLEIKESTVSWRIHEARKQLKQLFQSSSFTQEESRSPA